MNTIFLFLLLCTQKKRENEKKSQGEPIEQEKSEYQQAINKYLGKKYFFGNRLKSMNKRRNVNNFFSSILVQMFNAHRNAH